MGRKFKIGDHVCIDNSFITYNGKSLYGKVGTINDIINWDQYGVKLAGIINLEDPYGLFYFHETSLISQEAAGISIMEEIFRNIREESDKFKKFRDAISPVVLKPKYSGGIPNIENVIFNNPATIVFWSDGSKTIVKCKDEAFDEEKGLAMAISKKVLGNKGNYFNEFKKWLPTIEACEDKEERALDKYVKALRDNIKPGNARLYDEGE